MSLHPLSQEMLVAEVVTASLASGGGAALWEHGHPFLAAGAWGFAALVVAGIVGAAVAERRDHPPRQVLRGVGIALLGAGYLGSVGFAAFWLWTRAHPGLAVMAVIGGLWGGPICLAALGVWIEEWRSKQDP